MEELLPPSLQPLYEPLASLGTAGFEENGVSQPASQMRLYQDDVFAYQFAWDEEPPPMDFLIGAAHSLEIPFVFGNFQGGAEDMLGFAWSQANRRGREELSEAMMAYWGNFARTGNPNGPETDLPAWQPWSNEAGQPRRMLLDTGALHMF